MTSIYHRNPHFAMDGTVIFVYYFVMPNPNLIYDSESYYNPDVRILIIGKCVLRHWHYDNLNPPFWRLYWNDVRGAVIRHARQTIALHPGQFVLTPPNTLVVQQLEHAPVTHFFTHFLADAPFNRLHGMLYTFPAAAAMVELIKNMRPGAAPPRNDIALVMAVRGIIHCLLAKIPAANIRHLTVSRALADSLCHLESQIQNKARNPEIARRMGLSVSTMLRKYRRELGVSPQQYLLRKRIEKACILLYERKLSMEQIADATGFCDRFHFTKMFKACTGQSPVRLLGREISRPAQLSQKAGTRRPADTIRRR